MSFVWGLLIGCLLSISFAILALLYITRRYFQNRVIGKESYREMINRIYHRDQIPIAARIEGLMNALEPGQVELVQICKLLERPNHHLYGPEASRLARQGLECAQLARSEAHDLRMKIISTVKEFEYLQN